MSKKKTKIGQYPALNVMFSISVALFLGGLFGMLSWFALHLTESLQQQAEIKVFITTGTTEAGKQSLLEDLKTLTFKKAKIHQISLITKEEAANVLMKETGEDFVNLLGENPLKDYFSIKYTGMVSPEEQVSLKKLETKGSVYEIFHQSNILHEVNQNITNLSIALLSGTGIFLIGVFLLIHQAIRIALYSQRFLIRTMQLVGATDAFIRKPYLNRAAWLGLISGGFSILSLALIRYFLQVLIPDLVMFDSILFYTTLIFALLISGFGVSYTSTRIALNKYLSVNIDQLYK